MAQWQQQSTQHSLPMLWLCDCSTGALQWQVGTWHSAAAVSGKSSSLSEQPGSTWAMGCRCTCLSCNLVGID